MKKFVASAALLASTSSAFALVAPPVGRVGVVAQPRPLTRVVCLAEYQDEQGNSFINDCDESLRNSTFHRPLNGNGCADNQVAMKTTSVQVRACPTFIQL